MTTPHNRELDQRSTEPGEQPDAVSLLRDSYAGRSSSMILEHWRSLSIIATVGFGISLAGSFLLPPRFRADAKLASPPAQVRPQLAALGSLASSFGLSLGSGDYSTEFLAASLRARDVLDSMLMAPTSAYGSEALDAPFALYLVDADSLTPRRFEAARRELQERLSIELNYRSGIVSIGFWDEDPQVAATFLHDLLRRVNQQLIQFQRRFAIARRDYLKERLAAAQQDLSITEQESVAFQSRNRVVNSPGLQLEADRLGRRVEVALTVVQALQRQLDEAELAVRSDIPQVMVVESPVVPARKFFPSRRTLAALGALAPTSLWLLILALRTGKLDRLTGRQPSQAIAAT